MIDRTNVIGIVKLRDFALITPEQNQLTVKNLLEFHTRKRLSLNPILALLIVTRSLRLH